MSFTGFYAEKKTANGTLTCSCLAGMSPQYTELLKVNSVLVIKICLLLKVQRLNSRVFSYFIMHVAFWPPGAISFQIISGASTFLRNKKKCNVNIKYKM